MVTYVNTTGKDDLEMDFSDIGLFGCTIDNGEPDLT